MLISLGDLHWRSRPQKHAVPLLRTVAQVRKEKCWYAACTCEAPLSSDRPSSDLGARRHVIVLVSDLDRWSGDRPGSDLGACVR